jgi:hypothetical protein
MRRVLIVVLAVIALTGCSASIESRPSSQPTSQAPTATSSTPAPLTKAKAAEVYGRMVGDYVKAREGCVKASEAKPPSLDDLKAACRKTAATGRELGIALQAVVWPPEIQPLIDRRVEAAAVDQVVWRRVLGSESVDEFVAHVKTFSDDSSTVDELIRQKLGLPPAE